MKILSDRKKQIERTEKNLKAEITNRLNLLKIKYEDPFLDLINSFE